MAPHNCTQLKEIESMQRNQKILASFVVLCVCIVGWCLQSQQRIQEGIQEPIKQMQEKIQEQETSQARTQQDVRWIRRYMEKDDPEARP